MAIDDSATAPASSDAAIGNILASVPLIGALCVATAWLTLDDTYAGLGVALQDTGLGLLDLTVIGALPVAILAAGALIGTWVSSGLDSSIPRKSAKLASASTLAIGLVLVAGRWPDQHVFAPWGAVVPLLLIGLAASLVGFVVRIVASVRRTTSVMSLTLTTAMAVVLGSSYVGSYGVVFATDIESGEATSVGIFPPFARRAVPAVMDSSYEDLAAELTGRCVIILGAANDMTVVFDIEARSAAWVPVGVATFRRVAQC